VFRVLLIALVIVQPPVTAAVIVVDGVTCTLVDAITAANSDSATDGCSAGSGADEIQLTVDVTLTEVDNTTDGSNGLPSITSDVTIEGIGGSLPRAIVRDLAAPDFRIFDVASSGTLWLKSVSVRNGSSIGGFPQGAGGGIRNLGVLTLTTSEVSDNSANRHGGAIFNGEHGGNATVTLINSTVSGNTSGPNPDSPGSSGGGGIYNYFGTVTLTNSKISGNTNHGRWGGGISNSFGTVTLADSTVSGNSANSGGGIWDDSGTVTLTNSTLSGNSAKFGGGIYSYDGTVNLINSTVSGNSANDGGGIYTYYGTVNLTNSTVSGNSANSGGGICNYFGTVTLTGSLVANSLTGGNCGCSESITDSGDNLADDDTCSTIPDTLTGLDPVLADNGGPTQTHALLTGSSAIDLAGTCDLATDQRGALRPGGSCDSGAFEFIACPDLVLSNDTIVGTETEENCQNILVGPNFAVAGSGDLSLEAGKSVTFRNGTSVETDGQLTIEIDPDLQLVPPPP
jgi:hypothetical protein